MERNGSHADSNCPPGHKVKAMKLNASLRRSSPAVVTSLPAAAPPAVASSAVSSSAVVPGRRPLVTAQDQTVSAKQLADGPAQAIPSSDELQLIEAAQRGDRKAFQTIVEWHQGAVYGYFAPGRWSRPMPRI